MDLWMYGFCGRINFDWQQTTSWRVTYCFSPSPCSPPQPHLHLFLSFSFLHVAASHFTVIKFLMMWAVLRSHHEHWWDLLLSHNCASDSCVRSGPFLCSLHITALKSSHVLALLCFNMKSCYLLPLKICLPSIWGPMISFGIFAYSQNRYLTHLCWNNKCIDKYQPFWIENNEDRINSLSRLFKIHYLFQRMSERTCPSGSSLPAGLQQYPLRWAKAGSQDLNPGISNGWREPDDMNHYQRLPSCH